MCSFCNQRYISGTQEAPAPSEVEELLAQQQPVLQKNGCAAEIAFFGGSFTAVERGYMTDLLAVAKKFTDAYPEQYNGIRCSTRPDCIDGEILNILGRYGMTAIELGAQSMCDDVLTANNRGHNAQAVRNASRLIKERGFSLGLQMMTGLYEDTPEKCLYTADEFIKLKPDTVRIYPTVILRNTLLDRLREQGIYNSFDMETTVELCARLLQLFGENGIDVIRMGLHASRDVEREMTGGAYHPAMRELAESRLFLKKMRETMLPHNKYIIRANPKYISKIIGQKSENRKKLAQDGIEFTLIPDERAEFEIEVETN